MVVIIPFYTNYENIFGILEKNLEIIHKKLTL